VPEQLRWLPLVTFVQTGMDAMNAMLKVPGEFASFGHDYRADMAGFVGDAYRLPDATAQQLEGIERTLRTLELERAERIRAERSHTAPPAPAQRSGGDRTRGGVPLRGQRTRGPRWVGRRAPNRRASASAAGPSGGRSSA
jgi:Alpha/beta-hydrolase family